MKNIIVATVIGLATILIGIILVPADWHIFAGYVGGLFTSIFWELIE